jgi:hypothetical protein
MTKIIDIIPPIKSKTNNVRVFKKDEEGKNSLLKVLALIIILIIIILGIAFFWEGKGRITIYPLTKNIEFEEIIYISAKETSIDFENNILPGEYFIEKLDFEETFEATGSDETGAKATGTITVCNSRSLPLNLQKSTRFLSQEGNLTYTAEQALTIPAKDCIEATVIAEEAGEEYNLASSTFSVPGLLKYPDWYSVISGELKEGQALSGGSRSAVKVITEKDIEKAEETFKEALIEKGIQSLKKNLDEVGAYVYEENSFEQDFDKFITLGTKGDKVDNFKIQATITTKVLVFRKSDVDKFISSKILLTEENREFVPNTIFKEFKKDEENEDALILRVSAKTYPKISEVLLLNDIKGLEIEDCKNILKGFPEIKSADITASLFWKNRLPNKKENIDIEIEFED